MGPSPRQRGDLHCLKDKSSFRIRSKLSIDPRVWEDVPNIQPNPNFLDFIIIINTSTSKESWNKDRYNEVREGRKEESVVWVAIEGVSMARLYHPLISTFLFSFFGETRKKISSCCKSKKKGKKNLCEKS